MIDSKSKPPVSYMQVMRTLLAKDWRLFRVPMIALITLGTSSYLIVLPTLFFPQPDSDLLYWLVLAATASCELTALLAAAFGGIAIAGERTDGTADFIGVLPITRKQIMLSKWVVSVLMIIASAAFHVLFMGVAFLAGDTNSPGYRRHPHAFEFTAQAGSLSWSWICITLSFFGVAWLFSTFLRSGTMSACISILVTIASVLIASLCLSNHYSDVVVQQLLASVSLAIGVLSLVSGSLYYSSRVAP